MFKLLLNILKDEIGSTLAVTYSFSANTLISSTEMNTNFDDVEAVVNALTSTNFAADSVGPLALASTVVRTSYGLIQHTDGTLYVDVSDTNPCLEISDGGLRAKVDDSSIERASGGLQVKANGITSAMLEDDLVFGTFPLSPSAAPDADYELANKKYVDDQVDAVTGTIIQVVNTNSGAVNTGTTQTPWDDTIPQITEGDEYMTLAITPTSATSKLKIEVVANVANGTVTNCFTMALHQDTTANALAAVQNYNTTESANTAKQLTMIHYMTAGTASETTFRIRIGLSASGTTTFNGAAAGRKYGGVMVSSITITEIAA